MSTPEISRLAPEAPPLFDRRSAFAAKRHDSESGGHVVQFYSDDSFLIESLSQCVGVALATGDTAIIIATRRHRANLAKRLSDRALNVSKLAREGRYIAVDAAEALSRFMRDGQPDPAIFAATIGAEIGRAVLSAARKKARVVAFGEMVALLWADGHADAALQLEQLWNDLARQHSFSLRCAYPITGFRDKTHAAPFLKICAEHSAVIPGESYTALGTEQDRLRNIAELQQKAEALETEKSLLNTLRQSKEALERDIAERREAEHKLRDSELSLRELSGHLLRTQDEERRRLGRELHDTIGQYLAVLKMGLDSLNARHAVHDQLAAAQVADCLHLAEQSIKELRTMSYLLYPPMLEEMGLRTALHWYLEGFAKRSGIEVQLDICPNLGRLSRDVELTAFRVLQEGLTNIHHHSSTPAVRIQVSLEAGSLHLEISDTGEGLQPPVSESSCEAVDTMGVGLRGMNERIRQLGGTLSLTLDRGTTVRASLPCESQIAGS